MAEIDLSAFSNVVALGSGGLGDVYRATRRSTGGDVAIKVLRDWSDHDVASQRARRELQALVDLRGHPNVVNVEEVIESEGTLAIVMEFAPGGAVSDLMHQQGGTLGFAEALLVATHTASALAASHERGIIHRDIKPHNLLIDAFGQVKVCDFGIAALTRSEAVSNRTNSLSFRYASPEELRGDAEVTDAADVYSLAATVHQLLTGQYLPAPDGTAGSLPLRAWAAPDGLAAAVETEFRDLVRRSADRDPGARPSASELHDQFERLADRLGSMRCRALPLVAQDLDDATRIRSVSVADSGESSDPSDRRVPPAVPAASPVTAAAAAPEVGNTVVRTSHLPAQEPPPSSGASRSPAAVAAIVGVVAVLGLGGLGFALGWFGGGDPEADASTVTSTSSQPGVVDTTTATSDTSSQPATSPAVETTVSSAAPTTVPATTAAATTPATIPTTTATTATTTATTSSTTSTSTTTTTTLPERYAAPQCPGDGNCISMASIGIIDGEYSIEWDANFSPDVSSTHAHFFWDVYDAARVGSGAADQAPWELTDQRPFVPETEMRLANRPADATGICVTPADGSHRVIDPAYFHCALVAAGESWSAG